MSEGHEETPQPPEAPESPQKIATGKPLPGRAYVVPVAIGLGALLAAVMAFVLRGRDIHLVLLAIVAGLVAPAAILTGVITYAISLRRRRDLMRWIGSISFAVALVALLQIPSFFVGNALRESDLQAAQRFCESLVERLDEHKDKNGRYPEKIEAVLSEGERPPRLLRKRKERFYETDGSAFTLSFGVPRGFVDELHLYSSSTKKWTVLGPRPSP